MLHSLAICLGLFAAEDVTIKPLQGDSMRGSIVKLTEKNVVVQTPEGEVTLEASAIQAVKVQQVDDVAAADQTTSLSVEMVDDSILPGKKFKLASPETEIEFLDGKVIQFSASLVRAVKFRKQDERLQRQWELIAN